MGGGVFGHGTGFCLEEQRGCQVITLGGEGAGPEPQPGTGGALQTPDRGVQGHAQGSQMWGKVKERTREGKLECLLSCLKLQFLRSHPAGTARR